MHCLLFSLTNLVKYKVFFHYFVCHETRLVRMAFNFMIALRTSAFLCVLEVIPFLQLKLLNICYLCNFKFLLEECSGRIARNCPVWLSSLVILDQGN